MRRLTGDEANPYTCTACGAVVKHFEAGAAHPHSDYYVVCSNAECAHSKGVAVADTECPTWAHGPRKQDRGAG